MDVFLLANLRIQFGRLYDFRILKSRRIVKEVDIFAGRRTDMSTWSYADGPPELGWA